MLSMHPEDQFAIRLLKAGAAGYMTKECAPEELVGAVRKALAGGRYISPPSPKRWPRSSSAACWPRRMKPYPTASFWS